jgi:hypothetical protein
MDLHGREGRATAPGTIAFHQREKARGGLKEEEAKKQRGQ